MDTYDVDDARMLHHPGRADHLESLEEHLNSAARLSRAVWALAFSSEFSTGDRRNAEALTELASAAADHASAARVSFTKKTRPARRRRADRGDMYLSARFGRAHCSRLAHQARADRHEGGRRFDDGRRAPVAGRLAAMTVYRPRQRATLLRRQIAWPIL